MRFEAAMKRVIEGAILGEVESSEGQLGGWEK